MPTKDVKITSYMPYKNKNYGLNSIVVSVGELDLYFSYQTIIAFYDIINGELVVSENLWGKTTGKHLNAIQNDKNERLNREEFEERLNGLLLDHNLIKSPFRKMEVKLQTSNINPNSLPIPDLNTTKTFSPSEVGFLQIGGCDLRSEK